MKIYNLLEINLDTGYVNSEIFTDYQEVFKRAVNITVCEINRYYKQMGETPTYDIFTQVTKTCNTVEDLADSLNECYINGGDAVTVRMIEHEVNVYA